MISDSFYLGRSHHRTLCTTDESSAATPSQPSSSPSVRIMDIILLDMQPDPVMMERQKQEQMLKLQQSEQMRVPQF